MNVRDSIPFAPKLHWKFFLPAALAALFIFWRLIFLTHAHPFHLFVYVEEELYRGFIGKEIIHGLNLPFFDYRADDYSGGSLLMGILSAGFFKLFGLSVFSFKLISVLIFAGALVFWYLWLSRFANQREAILFSLLFIFSPLVFTRYSLTVLGDHPETIFFTALSAWAFFKTLSGRHGSWPPVLLGFFSGLALWMAYIYGVTLLTVLIYWYWYDRRFYLKRTFWITLLCFFLGFSPWILGGLQNHFQGVTVQGMPILSLFDWKNILKRILQFRLSTPYLLFSVHHLPGSVPEISSLWVMRFYRFMFLIPLIGFFWVQRKRIFERIAHPLLSPVIFSALHVLIFLFLCQATEYRELRYFIPSQPFIFYLALHAVIAVANRVRSKVLRNLGIYSYVSLLILASLVIHGKILFADYRGYIFSLKPYRIDWMLLSPACHTPQKCLETYERFYKKNSLTPDELNYFQAGVAQKLLEETPFTDPIAELKRMQDQTPREIHPYLEYFFGYEAMARENYNLKNALVRIQPLSHDPETFHRALSGFFRFHFPRQEVKKLDPADRELIPLDFLSEYWREQGFQWAENSLLTHPDYERLFLEMAETSRLFDQDEKRYFFQGVGMFLYFDWWLKPYQKHPVWDSDERNVRKSEELYRGAGMADAASFDYFQPIYTDLFKKKLKDRHHELFEEGKTIRADYFSKYPRPRL